MRSFYLIYLLFAVCLLGCQNEECDFEASLDDCCDMTTPLVDVVRTDDDRFQVRFPTSVVYETDQDSVEAINLFPIDMGDEKSFKYPTMIISVQTGLAVVGTVDYLEKTGQSVLLVPVDQWMEHLESVVLDPGYSRLVDSVEEREIQSLNGGYWPGLCVYGYQQIVGGCSDESCRIMYVGQVGCYFQTGDLFTLISFSNRLENKMFDGGCLRVIDDILATVLADEFALSEYPGFSD